MADDNAFQFSVHPSTMSRLSPTKSFLIAIGQDFLLSWFRQGHFPNIWTDEYWSSETSLLSQDEIDRKTLFIIDIPSGAKLGNDLSRLSGSHPIFHKQLLTPSSFICISSIPSRSYWTFKYTTQSFNITFIPLNPSPCTSFPCSRWKFSILLSLLLDSRSFLPILYMKI